jgi:hypothetical protein
MRGKAFVANSRTVSRERRCPEAGMVSYETQDVGRGAAQGQLSVERTCSTCIVYNCEGVISQVSKPEH